MSSPLKVGDDAVTITLSDDLLLIHESSDGGGLYPVPRRRRSVLTRADRNAASTGGIPLSISVSDGERQLCPLCFRPDFKHRFKCGPCLEQLIDEKRNEKARAQLDLDELLRRCSRIVRAIKEKHLASDYSLPRTVLLLRQLALRKLIDSIKDECKQMKETVENRREELRKRRIDLTNLHRSDRKKWANALVQMRQHNLRNELLLSERSEQRDVFAFQNMIRLRRVFGIYLRTAQRRFGSLPFGHCQETDESSSVDQSSSDKMIPAAKMSGLSKRLQLAGKIEYCNILGVSAPLKMAPNSMLDFYRSNRRHHLPMHPLAEAFQKRLEEGRRERRRRQEEDLERERNRLSGGALFGRLPAILPSSLVSAAASVSPRLSPIHSSIQHFMGRSPTKPSSISTRPQSKSTSSKAKVTSDSSIRTRTRVRSGDSTMPPHFGGFDVVDDGFQLDAANTPPPTVMPISHSSDRGTRRRKRRTAEKSKSKSAKKSSMKRKGTKTTAMPMPIAAFQSPKRSPAMRAAGIGGIAGVHNWTAASAGCTSTTTVLASANAAEESRRRRTMRLRPSAPLATATYSGQAVIAKLTTTASASVSVSARRSRKREKAKDSTICSSGFEFEAEEIIRRRKARVVRFSDKLEETPSTSTATATSASSPVPPPLIVPDFAATEMAATIRLDDGSVFDDSSAIDTPHDSQLQFGKSSSSLLLSPRSDARSPSVLSSMMSSNGSTPLSRSSSVIEVPVTITSLEEQLTVRKPSYKRHRSRRKPELTEDISGESMSTLSKISATGTRLLSRLSGETFIGSPMNEALTPTLTLASGSMSSTPSGTASPVLSPLSLKSGSGMAAMGMAALFTAKGSAQRAVVHRDDAALGADLRHMPHREHTCCVALEHLVRFVALAAYYASVELPFEMCAFYRDPGGHLMLHAFIRDKSLDPFRLYFDDIDESIVKTDERDKDSFSLGNAIRPHSFGGAKSLGRVRQKGGLSLAASSGGAVGGRRQHATSVQMPPTLRRPKSSGLTATETATLRAAKRSADGRTQRRQSQRRLVASGGSRVRSSTPSKTRSSRRRESVGSGTGEQLPADSALRRALPQRAAVASHRGNWRRGTSKFKSATDSSRDLRQTATFDELCYFPAKHEFRIAVQLLDENIRYLCLSVGVPTDKIRRFELISNLIELEKVISNRLKTLQMSDSTAAATAALLSSMSSDTSSSLLSTESSGQLTESKSSANERNGASAIAEADTDESSDEWSIVDVV